jgi:ABC-type branched-subunit amino acid transport system substrate-binding protein
MTDETGLAAPTFKTSPQGVEAGIGRAGKEGYNLKYVVVDTGSTPNGALSAAQKLVEQDHVFAVMSISGFMFAAFNFLASKGVPVIGFPDASEWIAAKNMFSVLGTSDYNKVYSQPGLVLKKLGVTNLGSIGYGVSPASSLTAKSSGVAAQLEGIKVGYLNSTFAYGSTDVAPLVLAMKNAGVNGLVAPIEINTEFALISGLRNQGVQLKAALMSTGYGGDLTGGGPGATQIAQGGYFETGYEPVEMGTTATKQLQSDLKSYAGVTTEPTEAQYTGYMAVDALVTGLKAAGSNPSQASFISAMLGITSYDGAGLFDGHSLSFALAGRGRVSGADNCIWITKYSGSSFHLISGMDPICGQTVPGKTVSGSSS